MQVRSDIPVLRIPSPNMQTAQPAVDTSGRGVFLWLVVAAALLIWVLGDCYLMLRVFIGH
jgi:hypothetical protein